MADFDPDCEHKLLQGQRAGKWLPFARRKVAALYDRAKAMGVTALVQHFTLESGNTYIAVRVVDDQRYIHIRRKECPQLTSGLAEGLVPTSVTIIDEEGNEQKAFDRFYERGADAWTQSVRLEPIAEVFDITTATPKVTSGRFSGTMRKVVQDMLGRALIPPYNYAWSTTHGVWTAEGGRDKWIIEISSAGIFAWPMRLCTGAFKKEEGGLDYVPLPSPKPQAPAVPKQLAPASAMTDGGAGPYSRGPLFSQCGWAFSEDGSRASNVTFEFGQKDYPRYLYTRLWDITITELDGVPESAVVNEVGAGPVWSPRLGSDRAYLKIPRYPGRIVHLPLDAGLTDGPAASGSPIFCWYDGNIQRVVRYYRMPAEVVPSGDGDPWGPGKPTGPGSPPAEAVTGSWFEGTRIAHGVSFESPVLPSQSIHDEDGTHGDRAIVWRSEDQQGIIVLEENINVAADTRWITDVIVIPINDREAVYHLRELVFNHDPGLQKRFYLNGTERQAPPALTDGNCYNGSATPPPFPSIGHIAYFVSGFTFDTYMVNQGSTLENYTKSVQQGPPPGWAPYPGCEPIEWWFSDGVVAFTTSPFSDSNLPTTSSGQRAGSGWALGKARAIDIDGDAWTEWVRVEGSLESVIQTVIVVPDAMDNIEPIYSRRPACAGAVCAGGPATIGATVAGGGSYPAGALNQTTTSFVGVP